MYLDHRGVGVWRERFLPGPATSRDHLLGRPCSGAAFVELWWCICGRSSTPCTYKLVKQLVF